LVLNTGHCEFLIWHFFEVMATGPQLCQQPDAPVHFLTISRVVLLGAVLSLHRARRSPVFVAIFSSAKILLYQGVLLRSPCTAVLKHLTNFQFKPHGNQYVNALHAMQCDCTSCRDEALFYETLVCYQCASAYTNTHYILHSRNMDNCSSKPADFLRHGVC
jgi:hypothetical protein